MVSHCAAWALLCLALCGPVLADKRVQELTALREKSKEGVIRLTEASFDKYADRSPRPYSLVIFCNAASMKESGNIRIKDLFHNFKLTAAHIKRAARQREHAAAAAKVFMVELEFGESRELFHRLGVNSLPWVVHIGPQATMKLTGMWNVHQDERMKQTDFRQYPWTPADFAAFIRARAHVDFGAVHVPKLTNNPAFLTLAALMLVPAGMAAWRVYTSSWIGHPLIWTTAVLAVFMFATSGGLHNIIRGVPLTAVDQRGRLQWYQPGQGQLGLEGFTVGGMYVAFALCCTGLLHVPKMLRTPWQRPACYVLLLGAMFLMSRIVNFYTWKTGYQLRFYLLERLLGRA